MIKMSFGTFVAFGAIYVSLKIARGEPWQSHGLLDVAALVAFIGLMYWLLRERRTGSDAAHHEQSGQSFAFRAGKALNRVFFRKGRSA